MIPNIFAMKRYMEKHLEAVREHGGEGLIAELVRVEKEGGRISRNEMVSMLFLLLFAGHETTTHLISGSVHELLKNPGLRDWLEEDWSRADLAVEEFLRFISPVQFTKPRFVRKDIELGGVRLKKGDRVMPMLAAANMDPQANAHPEKLDLERRPNRHVAFGTGIHFCLGHQLARIEGAMRAEGPVPALAEAGAGGGRIRDQMAQAARLEGNRTFTGRGGSLRIEDVYSAHISAITASIRALLSGFNSTRGKRTRGDIKFNKLSAYLTGAGLLSQDSAAVIGAAAAANCWACASSPRLNAEYMARQRPGATLDVTEMQPSPSWARKAKAVASSPDSNRNFGPSNARSRSGRSFDCCRAMMRLPLPSCAQDSNGCI